MASTTSAAANVNSGKSVPISLKRSRKADGSSAPPLFAHQETEKGSRGAQAREASSSTSRDSSSGAASTTQNVVVLGGSYGGMHAASVLAQKLPPTHRVILIERNSHFNHLYVFPRFSVLPGHEHKAFIPYSSIFSDAPPRGAQAGATASKQASQASKTAASEEKETSAAIGEDKHAAVRKGLLEFSSAEADTAERMPGDSARTSTSRDEEVASDSSKLSSSSYSTSSSSSTSSAAASARSSNTSWTSSRATLSAKPSRSPSRTREDTAPAVGGEDIQEQIAQDAGKLSEAKRDEEASGQREDFVKVKPLDEALEEATASTEDANAGGSPHLVLQATVTDINESHVTVTPARHSDPSFASFGASSSSAKGGKKSPLWSIEQVSIPYSHLVYALGSHLPDPLRTEARNKADGVNWMKRIQARVAESHEIVLVGGGALGVEFATDIASTYPMLREGESEEGEDAFGLDWQGKKQRKKKVTLIHSRKQLLPNFDPRIHDIAYARLQELGVRVVLGERLALTQGCPKGSSVSTEEPTSLPRGKLVTDTANHSISNEHEGEEHERKIIRTTGGKVFTADLLLLCTGQQPNSSLMAQLSPSSVDPKTRLVRVLPTLQVAVPDPRDAAQMPFEMRPPCGDCDCFLDRKMAGADPASAALDDSHEHRHHVEGLRNVYAIGDCADAFGAINAGYQAWSMADIAAENILRDVERSAPSPASTPAGSTDSELKEFEPAPTMLKLSLGLGKMVFQGGPVENPYDPKAPPKPEITVKEDPHDLAVEGVWTFMAKASTDDMYL